MGRHEEFPDEAVAELISSWMEFDSNPYASFTGTVDAAEQFVQMYYDLNDERRAVLSLACMHAALELNDATPTRVISANRDRFDRL